MEIRIGDLAKRSGCEVVTIRYYEKDFKALGDKGLFRLGFDVLFLFIMTVAFVWMVLEHLLSQPAY